MKIPNWIIMSTIVIVLLVVALSLMPVREGLNKLTAATTQLMNVTNTNSKPVIPVNDPNAKSKTATVQSSNKKTTANADLMNISGDKKSVSPV